jgi:2-alkyl-3-oxoalkanoate reductase
MRVLVTGANGFLGAHVARALAAGGHEVRGLLLRGTGPGDAEAALAEVRHGDVREPASLAPALRGCDAIVHLAAVVADSGPAHPFYEVNVAGTRSLLQAAARADVRRFVLVSSLAVHGFARFLEAPAHAPTSWDVNAYARSKILAEADVLRAHAQGRVEGVIVKPAFFPYGELDRLSLPALLATLRGGVFPMPGCGDPWLGTVYADSFARGVRLALEHAAAPGGTFVFGDDERVRMRALMRAIARAAGLREPRFVPLPLSPARAVAGAVERAWTRLGLRGLAPLSTYRVDLTCHDLHFSSAAARETLGYAPVCSLEEGLRRSVGPQSRAFK